MEHEGMVIRPPSEAESILLQVSLGCSHGKCAFCGAYQGKRFGIKDEARVFADIEYARVHCRDQRKLFLVDGDPLILPQPRLVRILERVRDRLPWVRQAGSYANAKAVARKSDAELAELRGLGLRVVHLGLESGDDETLRRMNKYGDAAFLLEQGLRVKAAGMRLFSTVLLGLAGPEGSGRHARATGRLLSRLAPDWTGALSLMLIPGTPLHGDRQAGRFVELGPEGLLRELGVLLAGIDVPRGQFFSNHASNHLPLRLRLPRDKDEALARIERALKGRETLRPEFSRRL